MHTLTRTPSSVLLRSALVLLLFAFAPVAWATSVTLTTNSVSPWIVPAGVSSVTVQMWGGGGGSGAVVATGTTIGGGGGGGGGGFTTAVLTVTPDSTIAFSVGGGGTAGNITNSANGGAGGNTTFTGATAANGGGGGGTAFVGAGDTNGAAGAAGVGGTYNGGSGAAGSALVGGLYGGGGGGSGGTGSIGNSASGSTGGAAVAGGGAGAAGSTSSAAGTAGGSPGGGAGGAYEHSGSTSRAGAVGAAGQIIITYTAAATALQVAVPGQAAGAGAISSTPLVAAVGVPVSVTIAAVDANGYVVTSSSPTVTFTSSDLAASLPGSTTLTNGLATVNVTFNTAGGQTVTATDSAGGGGLGNYMSSSVNVMKVLNVTTLTTNSTSPWMVPAGVTNVQVQMWGGGGGGGAVDASSTLIAGGGGGGGGGYTLASISVTPESTIMFSVGAAGTAGTTIGANGGNGGNTTFASVTAANGGTGGTTATPTTVNGAAGSGGTGGTFNGGNGAAGSGVAAVGLYGGGGGSAAGTGIGGNNASASSGGAAVTGGGAGAYAPTNSSAGGTNGGFVAGGGSGGYEHSGTSSRAGGAGAAGQIILTYVGTASGLQVVLPGQTVVAGVVSGTPSVQGVGVPFSVTVNAVDANGYVVISATPTVTFGSSDGFASLPGSTTLTNGTATITVTLNTGGGQTVSAMSSGLASYTSSSVTIEQAPLLETAPTASAITYGQALSASTLSGGACTNAAGTPVPGTFAFTAPATMPGAGMLNESVTFTPDDTNDYTSISFEVSVTIDQQVPTLQTTPTASDIYISQPLSASALTGGVCVNAQSAVLPGTFTFNTPSATPGIGTTNPLVTFNPTDAVDYSSITFTVSVMVTPFSTTTLTTNNTSPWTVPPGVTAITVQLWGGGGGGGGVSVSTTGSYGAGGGGGGGAYTTTTLTGLTPGSTIPFIVGASGAGAASTGAANGGTGGSTSFTGAATANGGGGGGGTSTAGVVGTAGMGGAGGAYSGGNGDIGSSTTSGGGGGSAGTASTGNNAVGSTGGTAVSGGGAGANGATGSAHVNGTAGGIPGGGGSGGFESNGGTLRTGGAGGAGQIVISVASPSTPQPVITSISLSGANLVLNGTNAAAGTYVVLMTTDLTVPRSSWTPVSTNVLSASGSFSIIATNAVNTSLPYQFYVLQTP